MPGICDPRGRLIKTVIGHLRSCDGNADSDWWNKIFQSEDNEKYLQKKGKCIIKTVKYGITNKIFVS